MRWTILSVVYARLYVCWFVGHAECTNTSIEHLQRYGYINEDARFDNISSGIRLFQETFNLTVDGTFNDETLSFMDRPRCGNKDDLLPFSAVPTRKWSNNKITWYMYGGVQQSDLVERAFGVWSKHANITFVKQRQDPMIYISTSNTQHMDYSQRNMCTTNFDGPKGALAHAFPPALWTTQTDIHFDNSENWDYSLNLPSSGSVSFYVTAIHEIGHAIGLGHSYVRNSIMWPYNEVPVGVSDLYAYDIHTDDVNAVQFLYGPSTHTTTPTTSTTTTTTTTTSTTTTSTTPSTTTVESSMDDFKPQTSLDICAYKYEFNHYLVFKDKLYVIHNKLVWVLSLGHSNPGEYTTPTLITDWLPFLPANFTNITAIYQTSNDEIVIIVDQWVYYIKTPDLSLIRKIELKTFVGRAVSKINAAFSTNQGKTFLVIDDWYVVQVNECLRRGTLLGTISRIFPGLPVTLSGGFRYTNGKLYFQTGKTVMEFDEYKETVTQSIDEVYDFIGISCIRESLLTKLYLLIKNFQ
jgi:hypothetical protein